MKKAAVDTTAVAQARGTATIRRTIVWAWLAIGSLNIFLSQIGGDGLRAALPIVASTLCGVAISISLHRFMQRHLWSGVGVSLPRILFAATACGSILWMIDVLIQAWADGHPISAAWSGNYFYRLRFNLVYFLILFALQAGGYRLLESELALAARERELLEARLAALRFQLNPHFMLNTLNAISALTVESGVEQAELMIARLSSFLRSTLLVEPSELVTLDAEIDLIQTYLDIETIRFGDRLSVQFACDAGLSNAQVPSLILQPLVENAVKYAVAPSKKPVTISITATSMWEEQLRLVVQDDGCASTHYTDTSSTGVGLANIRARLRALYGSSAQLEATRHADGFVAVIQLPLRRV